MLRQAPLALAFGLASGVPAALGLVTNPGEFIMGAFTGALSGRGNCHSGAILARQPALWHRRCLDCGCDFRSFSALLGYVSLS